MTAVETAEEVVVSTSRPAPQARSEPRQQPPYAVIVENDDLHTFDYVILALAKVFGYSHQKGYTLAFEIHTQGKAVVWSGSKEVAELKRDQLRGMGPDHFATKSVNFPLGVYIEPLPG